MIGHQTIVTAALTLASRLPAVMVEHVADAILETSSVSSLRAAIANRLANHHQRSLALEFVNVWQSEAPQVASEAVVLALKTAAHSEQTRRDSQSVELVWTGPDVPGGQPYRRTEQAILQIVDSAQDRLTLISCNVYRIGIVAHSLVKAAQRGVQLTVIMETPHKMGCKRDYNTLTALGKDVQDVCSVYYWPLAKRALGGNKAPGILHVKCLVADGRWLFLSSANFTRQAFTVNMELGLLVRGGSLPESVEGRFRRLVKDGVLELVDE